MPEVPAVLVSIAEVADDLQSRKQSIFRIVRRLGIQTTKQRDPDRGNQLVDLIAVTDVQSVRDALLAGRRVAASDQSSLSLDGETGYFYIIQLEPEHDRGRFKVGFTTDVEGRLAKHRCSAPFAVCLRSWPCRRTWERAAMDCVAIGSERLHNEVFRCPDLEHVLSRGDSFFALMPTLDEPDSANEAEQ